MGNNKLVNTSKLSGKATKMAPVICVANVVNTLLENRLVVEKIECAVRASALKHDYELGVISKNKQQIENKYDELEIENKEIKIRQEKRRILAKRFIEMKREMNSVLFKEIEKLVDNFETEDDFEELMNKLDLINNALTGENE